jgi:hypothetical protein
MEARIIDHDGGKQACKLLQVVPIRESKVNAAPVQYYSSFWAPPPPPPPSTIVALTTRVSSGNF